MEKYKNLIVPALIVVVVVLGAYFFKTKNQGKPIASPSSSPNLQQASMTIDDGVISKSFAISQFVGKTVLVATTEVLENKVTVEGTGENAFIAAIGDRAADPEKNEFWELLINGKASEVGAGSYEIQNGDVLLWRISTY